MKTNKGLVEYAKAQLGKPYWYGTFGQAASESLYKQKRRAYPTYYLWAYKAFEEGVKVHDCVGLVKGYLWSNSPYDAKPAYNAAQDISANGMRKACKESGTIDTIPEVPGLLVFYTGHVGIYIGNGEVIEARGRKYGVVKTKLKERKWKWWGYCPYMTYEKEQPKEEPIKMITVELPVLKKGMKLPEVKTLQRLLNSFGATLEIDGSFGGKTDAALRIFQGERGLEVDGKCGPASWNALLR